MAKIYAIDLDEGEKVELVALIRLDSLSHEAVSLALKKQSQTLTSWWHVKVTDQRTKQDLPWCMQDLVEIHFPEAESGWGFILFWICGNMM